MTKPVVTATTLVTEDGVPIDAIHLPGVSDLAIVVAHGFTLSWQRPNVWRIANRFNQRAGVLSFDFRGHGRSGGLSTLGDREISDLDVVVAWARQLGYQRVAAVGFSMGASIVLRHAGLIGGLDAVVSVSGPGRWYYRGTEPMRRVHFAVEHRIGRFVTRRWLKTRISPQGWKLVPVPPAEAAAQISPVPLLIVHGDKDHYFPPEHARQLYMAAREPKELWLIPGMGHAESACSPALVDRISRWVDQATAQAGRTASVRDEAGAPSPDDARAQTPNAAALAPCAASGHDHEKSGPAGFGVDDDPYRVYVIAGFIEVLVWGGRVERDRVARA
jgi:pimeloyl-ACP methyl ester carboxylesterase